MNYYETVASSFAETVEAITASVDLLADPLHLASQLMTGALLEEHKILVGGYGPDAAVSALFCNRMAQHPERERPCLPTVNLSADSVHTSAFSPDEALAQQVQALGQAGDILVLFASQQAPAGLLRAAASAQSRQMPVVAVGSELSTALFERLTAADVELRVGLAQPARTLELHVMLVHSLCELIDQSLFGAY